MGGKAFSSGLNPLSTPRMPPEIYYVLRDHYLALLSSIFVDVATPIEAPSKSSYGDIDIIVSQPRSASTSTDSLAKALGAERVFTNSGSATTSFAVPYPDSPNIYVQMDIHLCQPSSYHWQVFHQSHGDLWNLLGTSIRPFGLTGNDVGLHLRIAEIENLDRKKSLVLLTMEPELVLNLLELDLETYQRPFVSLEAMYTYVVKCPFFRRDTYMRSKLKANDRKRLAQRELYSQFVDVWLPENEKWIEDELRRKQILTKENVLERVLDKFGKRQEYNERLLEWRTERGELLAKQGRRQRRKAEALELEEYANAWMRWLEHNTS